MEDDEDAAADGSQALVRIPRSSHVYIPPVGPRPVPQVPPLNDALGIEFDMDNPKHAGSTSLELYELYKPARPLADHARRAQEKAMSGRTPRRALFA